MSKLFIVPTPIGNLEDISLRALRILKEADHILCEDTRVSSKLLQKYEIKTNYSAHHQHNEHLSSPNIIKRIQNGENIALISDAGTPAISDPGYFLVRACVQADIEVECLPGATAFVPALVNSAIACDRFLFEGFLPHQKGRKSRLEALALQERSFVLYESPHRLIKTLEQLCEYIGRDRRACVCRELSKLFEENKRDSLENLLEYYTKNPAKGEIVIVVEGSNKESFSYQYPRPALCSDVLLLTRYEAHYYILLIKRKNPPFEASWALPGGFLEEDESLEWCAQRELKEETGIRAKDYQIELKHFRAYSEPERDPRGRIISMVFAAQLDCDQLPEILAGDDAKDVKWFNIDSLPLLAFDHQSIIQDFIKEKNIAVL